MAKKRSSFKNIISGCDDIYFTRKKIAVRKVATYKNKMIDTTRYYPKTKSNVSIVLNTYGRVRTGRN